ncbi:hypothetical protein ACNFV9_003806, partial [Escherichia coli]
TATSGGITATPVVVPAVPGSHHIGSICFHDAPSHYTSERNITSQHHSTSGVVSVIPLRRNHQRKDNRHRLRQTMLTDSGASVPDVTPARPCPM